MQNRRGEHTVPNLCHSEPHQPETWLSLSPEFQETTLENISLNNPVLTAVKVRGFWDHMKSDSMLLPLWFMIFYIFLCLRCQVSLLLWSRRKPSGVLSHAKIISPKWGEVVSPPPLLCFLAQVGTELPWQNKGIGGWGTFSDLGWSHQKRSNRWHLIFAARIIRILQQRRKGKIKAAFQVKGWYHEYWGASLIPAQDPGAHFLSCWECWLLKFIAESLVQDLPSVQGTCVTQGYSPFQGATCIQWLVHVKVQRPVSSIQGETALQASPTPELPEGLVEVSVATRSPTSSPTSSSARSSNHCLTSVPQSTFP